MSNKHAGVTSATIGGEKFAFKATLNALVEIEEETGKDFTVFASSMAEGISIRDLLTCGKAFAKAGGGKNADKLGDASADIEGLSKAVGACITAMFPDREETTAKN
jgi:hypothetical protein